MRSLSFRGIVTALVILGLVFVLRSNRTSPPWTPLEMTEAERAAIVAETDS